MDFAKALNHLAGGNRPIVQKASDLGDIWGELYPGQGQQGPPLPERRPEPPSLHRGPSLGDIWGELYQGDQQQSQGPQLQGPQLTPEEQKEWQHDLWRRRIESKLARGEQLSEMDMIRLNEIQKHELWPNAEKYDRNKRAMEMEQSVNEYRTRRRSAGRGGGLPSPWGRLPYAEQLDAPRYGPSPEIQMGNPQALPPAAPGDAQQIRPLEPVDPLRDMQPRRNGFPARLRY